MENERDILQALCELKNDMNYLKEVVGNIASLLDKVLQKLLIK